MTRLSAFLLVAAVTSLLVPSVRAQDSDSEKVPFEQTPEMEEAEAVALAASLAAYGRRTGSAQALVASAALLIDNPAPLGRLEDDGEGAPESEEPVPSLDPSVLLDEADALTPPDGPLRSQIAELRGRLPEPFPPVRGAERGPIRYAASADAETTRRHALTFRGRETATFHLVGDGSSDLDYYLYDVNGELVASSDDPRDSATLFWYVPYRQRLTLHVRNRGGSRNAYHIVTN